MDEKSTLELVDKLIKAQEKFNKSFERISKDNTENITTLDNAVRVIEEQKTGKWDKHKWWLKPVLYIVAIGASVIALSRLHDSIGFTEISFNLKEGFAMKTECSEIQIDQ